MPKNDKKKILIAEDDVTLSKTLNLKLTSEGFEVTTSFNGENVLKRLQEGSYDLLLLDLIMPKINGFDVLAKMKELHIKIPVIVASNLNQDEDVKRAKSLGAIDYLVKSNLTLNEIVDKIKKRLQ